MKETSSRTLFMYWNEVRRDRLAPQRFEIEPSSIGGILPDTFILERINSATAKFRLAGTRICDAFGEDFRGVNIFELFRPEDRVTLQRQFAVIGRQGAAGVFHIMAESPSGLTAQFEMLVLPLLHTQNTVDRFIGSIATADTYPWLGTEPLGKPKLISHELVWPEGNAYSATEASGHQAPFLAHVREARIVRSEHRNFRVYSGGLDKPAGKT